ncbi:BTAD domain-containing putative transcriptional regulator [Prescottella agglutinans]|uniref:BTAD domain-containing putative transcriptional regulator n=1 Tax=Prescottella agglutinans TaxID=1644129 RepID=UPI003D966435
MSIPPTCTSDPVTVNVLGALEVRRGDQVLSVGGPNPRAVLIRLLIAEGRVVSDDALIDDVWEDDPPQSALVTLQGNISRLRKALGTGGDGAPAILVREGHGYALRPNGVSDVHRFQRLLDEGRALIGAGKPDDARILLADALGLWRGPAFADCGDRRFAVAEIRRLEELRAAAFEDLMAAELACGNTTGAAAALEPFTAQYPLREKAWELRALALYRCGRQAEALEALRCMRERLADELGADPGPGLAALEVAILRQDDALLGRATPVASAATESADAPTHNVPVPLTEFVGRADQLAEVAALLETHRLVTLTGTGGMGKTRTAIEVARRRNDPDGPWVVELAAMHDGEQLASAVATALGVVIRGGTDELLAILRDRNILLGLDNCEQVLEPVSIFVTELLGSCPGVRVLATSREALGAPGEFVYEVPALSTREGGDAVELFVQRASERTGGWTPEPEDLELLTTLCAELDGMPLAIELAAAQCRTLSVRQLVDNIDDRFTVLRGGPRANRRHTTMLAAVEWSYRSLSPSEQHLFQSLAIFEGGFDLDSARAVAESPGLLTDLHALIDKSLIKSLGGDPRRYRMLETLRSYAALQRPAGLTAELRRRHTDWVCRVADEAYLALRGPDCPAWMRRLDADFGNVRAALDANTRNPATYIRIVAGIYWYWYRRGAVAEGLFYLDPIASMDHTEATVSTAVRSRALGGLTLIRYLGGDIAGLLEAFGLLAEISERIDDPGARGDANVILAFFESNTGLIDVARAHAGSALAAARDIESPHLAAEAHMCLGTASFRSGGFEEAAAHFAEAVRIASACGYGWCEGSSLWLHAKSELAQDRFDGPAERRLIRMTAITESLSDHTSWLVALATLAYARFRAGDHNTAARLTGVVDRYSELIGYVPSAMDPIDLQRYDTELRTGIAANQLRAGLERGRSLSRAEIRALVRRLAG